MVNILKHSQGNLEKEQSWKTHNSQFYNRVQSSRNQSVDKVRHKILESTESPEINLHIHSQLIFSQGTQIIIWGKEWSFQQVVLEQLDILDIHMQKIHVDQQLAYKMGFPGSSAGKEFTCNAGDPGSIPGSGRSPGEGISYPLQYSWASLVAQMVKNLPAMQETWVRSLEDPWRRKWEPSPVFLPR